MNPVIIGDATLSGIYAITNSVNGKQYVGSSISLVRRRNQHYSDLSLLKHKSPKLQAAWNKYGPECFSFSVLEFVGDWKMLIAREQSWIDALDASVKGYNILPIAGSRLGTIQSEESRKKMSDSQSRRIRKPCAEETKKKISDAQIGKKKSPRSAAYRLAMSVAMNGKRKPPRSEKYKSEAAAIRLGKKATEATKLKMAASQKLRWSELKGVGNDD